MGEENALKQTLVRIKMFASEKQLPIVIFDLDDTLFATARRDLVIIRNFAADHSDDYPDFAEVAGPLTLDDMSWSAESAIIKAGLSKDSPSLKPFVSYWSSAFFTNEYCALDLPILGAVDYVNACYDAGALVYYLTGRGVGDRKLNNGMGLGTALALTNRGFPFWEGRCELNLKADPKEPDEKYKERIIECVKSLRGQVVATFDNEPANANMFFNHFPDALNFWVKTTWNPNDPEKFKGTLEITDFSGGAG